MTQLTDARCGGGALPVHGLRECEDCGKLWRLPPLSRGMDACCLRCNSVLARHRPYPPGTSLALCIAALFLYAIAVTMPFFDFNILGRERIATLQTGPEMLSRDGLWELAGVVVWTALVAPLLKLTILLIVLIGIRLPTTPRWLYLPFRWYRRLGPWSMLEVFLFGALVAYTKLIDMAPLQLGTASAALALLILTMVAADAALDTDAVWHRLDRRGATAARNEGLAAPPFSPHPILGCPVCHMASHALPGMECPRCGTVLTHRKPASLARSAALAMAAAMLYLPANIYPVMNIVSLGHGGAHTILNGVEELAISGMWPLAALVFLASIAVPVLKLVSLTVLLVSTRRGARARLRDRTLLYRMVEAVGRWSMIDIFMVSILVALVRFGQIAQITSGLGAVCFASVVILTMFATQCFDPRLMWDAAERPPHPG